jgi:biotin carboxyl carrier protein
VKRIVLVTPRNGAAQEIEIEVAETSGSSLTLAVGAGLSVEGRELRVDAVQQQRDVLSLLIEGASYEAKLDPRGIPGIGGQRIIINGEEFAVEVLDPRSLRSRKKGAASDEGPKKITAPMPGKVVRVSAPAGTEVEAGQSVIVIEAMKMQNELKSPKKGRVQKILAAEGTPVNAGDTLAIVE